MFTKLRDAIAQAQLEEHLPGMILGGLGGGLTGYLTSDDDEVFRTLMYALGGAAAGRIIPGINEMATEFVDRAKEDLPKLRKLIE